MSEEMLIKDNKALKKMCQDMQQKIETIKQRIQEKIDILDEKGKIEGYTETTTEMIEGLEELLEEVDY